MAIMMTKAEHDRFLRAAQLLKELGYEYDEVSSGFPIGDLQWRNCNPQPVKPKQEIDAEGWHRLVMPSGAPATQWAGYRQITMLNGWVGATGFYLSKEDVVTPEAFCAAISGGSDSIGAKGHFAGGEVLGGPDGVSWPDDLKTFAERAAYQRGVKDARDLAKETPIDMVLYCPNCGEQHIDAPDVLVDVYRDQGLELQPRMDGDGVEWNDGQSVEQRPIPWNNRPHRSHLCHACGCVWRPADVPTNGVKEITTKGEKDTWVWNSPFAAIFKEDGVDAIEYTLHLHTDDPRKARVLWSMTRGKEVQLGISVEGVAPEVKTAMAGMASDWWTRAHSIAYPARAAAIINAALGNKPTDKQERATVLLEQALEGEHGPVAKLLAEKLAAKKGAEL